MVWVVELTLGAESLLASGSRAPPFEAARRPQRWGTMATTAPSAAPRGWYPDPAGSDSLRLFEAGVWTTQLRPAALPAPQAPGPSALPVTGVAAWLADPRSPGTEAFFDGWRWTGQHRPIPCAAPAPTSAPIPTSAPAACRAPARRSLAAARPATAFAPTRRSLAAARPSAATSAHQRLLATARASVAPLLSQLSDRLHLSSLSGVSSRLHLGAVAGRARPANLAIVAGVMLSCYFAWAMGGSDLYAEWNQQRLRENLVDAAPLAAPAPTETTLPAGPVALVVTTTAPPPAVPAPAAPTASATAPARPATPAPAPRRPASATPAAPVGTLRIPSIGVDQVILGGTTKEILKKGPGVWEDGVMPGQPGNATISGHRTTYGAPFRKLDRLNNGDRIIVSVPGQPDAVYEVRGKLIVAPTQVSVTGPTEGVRLTLTTCDPVGSAAARLVIEAEMVSGAHADKAVPADRWQLLR